MPVPEAHRGHLGSPDQPLGSETHMTRNAAPAQDNRALFLGLLVAVCMLGFALRLYDLSADSLWYDEISTATRSQLDPGSLLRAVSSFGIGHELPLIYLVTRFFVLLFGDSEFILRMPAVLFGALSILLVYKVGALLWTRQEGLIAALLLSLNSHHVNYSQEARHYALLVFLALLSLIFLLKALRQNRASFWAGFAICMILSLYTHYFAFLFLAAATAFGAAVLARDSLTIAHQDRPAAVSDLPRGHRALAKPLVRFSASLALIALAYLPWLPTFQALISSQAASELPGVSLASAHSTLSYLREVLAAYAGVGGVVLLLYLGVVVAGLVTAGWQPSALALLWMGIPLGFFLLVRPDRPVQPRYLLFVLPLYLLVMARGVVSLTGILHHRLRRSSLGRIGLLAAAAGFALLFALTSALSLRNYYSSPKEDWRSAASYLMENAPPGTVVLASGKRRAAGSGHGTAPGWGDAVRVERGLSYYLSRYQGADLPIFRVKRGLWNDLEASATSGREIWAVLWYPGRLKAPDSVTVAAFHQVAVLRLRNPSGDALQDTASMLQVLIDVLPSEADFDVLLALAELHQHTGNCEQASLALHRASRAKPGDYAASEDLTEAVAEWEEGCSARESLVHPLWLNLGDLVACFEYGVHPRTIRAGGTLQATVSWQALGGMDRNYSVFIHLVNGEGHLWAQLDELLARDERPTSTWAVGSTVAEDYRLQVPLDIPSGEYSVKTGIYYWETGERLAVSDLNGRRLASDAIPLGLVTVVD